METKRNAGIDILRILSMLGIIGLHIINQGGIISNLPINTTKHNVVLLLLTILFASVNIFGIMTGYLNVNKRENKNKRIIELILITLFWSIVITSIFYGFNLYNIRSQGIRGLITNILPFITGQYWYITMYILLFLMIPYINVLIKNLTKKQMKTMLIVLFILLSIIPNVIPNIVPNIVRNDMFAIKNGYSPFWLIYCYMIGAYIRLYKDEEGEKGIIKKSGKVILPLLLAYVCNIAVKNILVALNGRVTDQQWFIDYVSPFIILFAIKVFMVFKSIKIKKELIAKIIKWISMASFSVYIIHCHRAIFDFVNKDLFVFVNSQNTLIIIATIILSMIGIYIACMLLDQLRILIFKLCRINRFIEFVGYKMDRILNTEKVEK